MGAMLERLRIELAMRSAALPNPSPPREPLLNSFDLNGVAQLIRSGEPCMLAPACGPAAPSCVRVRGSAFTVVACRPQTAHALHI